MSKGVVEFEVWGKVPSKSNFRYSASSEKSKRAWQRIKSYEATIGHAAMAAGAKCGRDPKPIVLTVMLINQTLDLDNAMKAPIDGIKGVVIPDDSPEWIPRINIIQERTDDGEPKVRYHIRYLAREEAA